MKSLQISCMILVGADWHLSYRGKDSNLSSSGKDTDLSSRDEDSNLGSTGRGIDISQSDEDWNPGTRIPSPRPYSSVSLI